MNSMKDLLILMEGKKTRHQEILESFQHNEYRKIYKEWYEIGSVLSEAQISQEQVQAIFNAIATGAKNGENTDAQGKAISNRTLLGKGTDVASKIGKAWDDFKTKIALSGPVSGFDVAFSNAQSQLLSAVGGDKGAIGKALQKYKEFATKYPKMQGAIYAGIAILVGISGWGLGGAAVLAGIRTLDRLLQGDRASSALWKGFKTGAVSYAAGQLGDYVKGSTTTPIPDPVKPPITTGSISDYGPGEMPGNTTYTVQSGDTLSDIANRTHTGVGELQKVNPQITNPDVINTGQEIKLAPAQSGQTVYQGGAGTSADTMNKIATGQYTDSPISQAAAAKAAAAKAAAAKAAAAKAAAAKAGTLVAESIDYAKIKRVWALQESMKLPQQCSVYLTPYGVDKVFRKCEQQILIKEGLWDGIKKTAKAGWESATNKITYDKLNLWWKKNHGDQTTTGPVDTKEVIDFLKKMGVGDTLINKTFTDLKIPTGDVTPATSDFSVPGAVTPELTGDLPTSATDAAAPAAGAAAGAGAGAAAGSAPMNPFTVPGSVTPDMKGKIPGAATGSATGSAKEPAGDGSLTPEQMTALINPMVDQMKELWEKISSNQSNKIGDPKVREALARLAQSAIKMSNSTGSTNPIKMTNVPGTYAESKMRRK